MISVIIPARNEPYLEQTTRDLLAKAAGEIEIIIVLDGCPAPMVEDKRVRYIHKGEARGLRAAINSAVAISRGEHLLKIDAHCLVDAGYDVKLLADYEGEMVMVPRRHRLNPARWEIDDGGRPPVDYERLDGDLRGKKDSRRGEIRAAVQIDDLMTFQGSCWFMSRGYFDFLELMDEQSYGTFFAEAQEICLKAWLSGGRCMVNKNTWYAHWHKDRRGYLLTEEDRERARAFVLQWKTRGRGWHKQTRPIEWLYDQFAA